MYFRKKISGGRVYLQIAASRRVGGQVRQRVIATLGRLDALAASGQVERLVRSGARFATRAMVDKKELDAFKARLAELKAIVPGAALASLAPKQAAVKEAAREIARLEE